VTDYGYCGFCQSLSVYDTILSSNHIRCRACGLTFYPDQLGLSYLFYLNGTTRVYEFKLGDNIPKRQLKIAGAGDEHLRSQQIRSQQRKLFNEMLESRIASFKKEQRVLASKVRRLAKLRAVRKRKEDMSRWALNNLS